MYEGDEVEVALKQRLIGAATLLALAVIILPIFLDGSGDRIIREIPKPPLPSQPVDQPIVNQQAIPEPTKMAAIREDAAQSPDTEPTTAPQADQPASPVESVSESADTGAAPQNEADAHTQAEPATAQVTTQASEQPLAKDNAEHNAAQNAEKLESKVAAAAAEPRAPASASQPENQQNIAKEARSSAAKVPIAAATSEPQWIIQMASFAQEPKALALRDQLRSKGYKAFVENFDNQAAQTLYRVRVGPPRIQRDKAEAELQEIQKKINMRGYIAKFP